MTDAKVVFLDIDGVLNDCAMTAGCPRILPKQAGYLDVLLRASGAKVVLTSSWRKWLRNGVMNQTGLELLLGTHGITASVIGTLPDRALTAAERGPAIARYAASQGITRYVVLDDRRLEVPNLVQTNSAAGLTCEDVVEAYRILRDSQ